MRLSIHRKEQWDLGCRPVFCIHLHRANVSQRMLCVWRWGIVVYNVCYVSSQRIRLGRRIIWEKAKLP